MINPPYSMRRFGFDKPTYFTYSFHRVNLNLRLHLPCLHCKFDTFDINVTTIKNNQKIIISHPIQFGCNKSKIIIESPVDVSASGYILNNVSSILLKTHLSWSVHQIASGFTNNYYTIHYI